MTESPQRSNRTILRRLGFGAVRVTLISYIAVLGFLYAAQTWLIFPGHDSQGSEYARVVPPADAEMVTLTTPSGEQIVALFGAAQTPDGSPRSDAAERPTIIFFYGNGDCLRFNADTLGDLRRQGANVLIPEYVGYGMSTGSPSEDGCYETATAAFGYLISRTDIRPDRIVVAGWSLGAAVAIDLAVRKPVGGLAVFSPFTSMADMGSETYPFIPVSWLLRHRFENESKIPRVACPILIGHSRRDSMIPFRMADRLAEAATAPVVRLTLDNGDHNEFFSSSPDVVLPAIGRFVSTLAPPA